MEEKKLELAIRRMVENVNYQSHETERAKKKNLHGTEKYYFYKILGIAEAISYLGYTLDEDGIREDCIEGEDSIEYMHYKAIKR